MPILMPSDTLKILGENAQKCESRALFMDKFARPDAEKEDRKKWFELLARKAPVTIVRRAVTKGTEQSPLYAQLQSRLMVNMAGGVMENAGLCLDRFGLPYIPGSAVKGCARRMAIQQLLEVETIQAKTDLLAQIAMVFGWGEQDWSAAKKDGRFKSDFAYAVGGESWPDVVVAARRRLPDTSHFAGVVSFLPAHPVDASGAELPVRPAALGALELDVLTCHHSDYYSQKKNRAGDLDMPAALDNEPPIPVIFPAVAAGHGRIKECSPGFLAELGSFAGPETQILDGLGAQLRGLRNGYSAGPPGRSNPTPLGSSQPRQASAVCLRPVRESAGDYRIVVFEAPAEMVLGRESRQGAPRLKDGVPPPGAAPQGRHGGFGGQRR